MTVTTKIKTILLHRMVFCFHSIFFCSFPLLKTTAMKDRKAEILTCPSKARQKHHEYDNSRSQLALYTNLYCKKNV